MVDVIVPVLLDDNRQYRNVFPASMEKETREAMAAEWDKTANARPGRSDGRRRSPTGPEPG